MTDRTRAAIPLLHGRNFTAPHGITTRDGGCSPRPFASLNLSYGVGDLPENVAANRQLVKQALNVPILVSAGQVHGEEIFCVGETAGDLEVQGFDALLSDRPGIGLLIQQADCQAVLLHDPDRQVVAAIHCGWRGNAVNIIARVVARLRADYGSRPASLRALISPSLGPCCAEFRNFAREFPPALHPFRVRPDYFDLWQVSTAQLTGAGVPAPQIEIMGICTSCRRDFFSYRRSRREGLAATGRSGSVIALPG